MKKTISVISMLLLGSTSNGRKIRKLNMLDKSYRIGKTRVNYHPAQSYSQYQDINFSGYGYDLNFYKVSPQIDTKRHLSHSYNSHSASVPASTLYKSQYTNIYTPSYYDSYDYGFDYDYDVLYDDESIENSTADSQLTYDPYYT